MRKCSFNCFICCLDSELQGVNACDCNCSSCFPWLFKNRDMISGICRDVGLKDDDVDSMLTLIYFLKQKKEYDGVRDIVYFIRSGSPLHNMDLRLESQLALIELQIAEETSAGIQEKLDYYNHINGISFFRGKKLMDLEPIIKQPIQQVEPFEPPALSKVPTDTGTQRKAPDMIPPVDEGSKDELAIRDGTEFRRASGNIDGLTSALKELHDEIKKLNKDIKNLSRNR